MFFPYSPERASADQVLATARARSQISESRQKVSVCLVKDADEDRDLAPGHGFWGLLLAHSSVEEEPPSSPAL